MTDPVITGLGVASAAGIGVEHFWDGLLGGRPRQREVSLFPTEDLPNHVACEIGEWTPGADRLDGDGLASTRTITLALAALDEAIQDAGLDGARPDRILVGTTVGEIADSESVLRHQAGLGQKSPEALAVDGSLRDGLTGAVGGATPTELLVTACSAGNMAIVRAAQLIRSGQADVVVCGGAEAMSRMAFVGFSRMRGMARERCRPFSDDRDGMLLGEGAAFLVVESAAHARQRGATIQAHIEGYGLTCDARHPAAPDPTGSGAARAMAAALETVGPDKVDFVCAHGTATPQNDSAEALAYSEVFGQAGPPVSSIKALIGHALGAASAIEAVACILAIRNQRTIPQWGLDNAPSALPVRLASGAADEVPQVDYVLNSAFAFGGNNTAVTFSRSRDSQGSGQDNDR